LIDKFWGEIEDGITDVVRRQKPKLNQKFKVLIQYYVMLKEKIHPKQLNRDIIEEVIGSNYIKIYDKL